MRRHMHREQSGIGMIVATIILVAFTLGVPAFWSRYYADFYTWVQKKGISDEQLFSVWSSC
jgi:hypothetical protein